MIPLPIFSAVISALAAGIVAGAGAWVIQENRYERQLSDIHAEQALALAAATENARATEAKWHATVAESERWAALRQSALARDLARTRSVADGLRNDLSAARAALPTASSDSLREHAATLNTLFGECSAEVEGLAGPATGHAIDSLKLQQAWPR